MPIYPINAGHPDYSGTLIPTIWAKKLLQRFYDATVLSEITNTDYEGEIRNMGDKVTVNTIPDITISDYAMGDTLAVQKPGSGKVELTIDKGKYWNFILDDVAEAQSIQNMMGPWADNASEQMKIVLDTDVLAFLVGKAAAANRGAAAGRISANINLGIAATPVAITKTSVLDYIVDMGTVLDEQNVPETGRKLVIPAWMAGQIKKSDLKDASITGDGTSVLRNGRIGVIDRFELFSSNLLPKTGANHYVFATHSHATTFATQLTKTEQLRAESTFGNLMRGLIVYGRKVMESTFIAEGVVVKA